ncbi:MAG: alkaline phosphatase family protein [Prevotella sp.]|nr:alkaline phosphatase family protein [Prevotella sp.]
MKKAVFLFAMLLCSAIGASAQSGRPQFGERPRLVVGIVVDQMCWDYLSRYYDQFSNGGFRRLIDQGYSFDNCLIDYLPTVTAIGHTSAYTGTTPAFHGICGNNFYIDGRRTYCCADSTVMPVGSDNKKDGQMSPKNLLATTIGDQLRLHTDFRSKVIGVSYKDRAAILPAGHSGNAAYWLDRKNRQFITSTYYMQDLPQWARDYNRELLKDKDFKRLGNDIGLSSATGRITVDMAIAALDGERLGQGSETDMLCVSFSQTDVIGHKWGTRGEHTDEAYLQLDRDLARLLDALDAKVGRGNYLLFLTADHGAAHNWKFMQDNRLHAGAWLSADVKDGLEKYIAQKLGSTRNVVLGIADYRFYLDHEGIRQQGLDLQRVKQVVVEYLRQSPNLSFVADYEKMAYEPVPQFLRERMLNGYHFHRSGDIIVCTEPGFYEVGSWSSPVGTTHGEWNPYDAHIPLLFFGWRVPHGASSAEVHITDIAPTVCSLLHIQQPNGCIGGSLTFK